MKISTTDNYDNQGREKVPPESIFIEQIKVGGSGFVQIQMTAVNSHHTQIWRIRETVLG